MLTTFKAHSAEYCLAYLVDHFRGALNKGMFMEPLVTTAIDSFKSEETLNQIFQLGY